MTALSEEVLNAALKKLKIDICVSFSVVYLLVLIRLVLEYCEGAIGEYTQGYVKILFSVIL